MIWDIALRRKVVDDMKIKLDLIDEVKMLTVIAAKYESDIFLTHDKYVIDATSLLGILSLNLHNPVKIEIVEKKEGEYEGFISELRSHGFNLIEN